MSSWLIRVDGLEFNSDDLLIEDVGAIEKASGESWYIANPLVSIAVGRAFLAAAMLRSGRTPDVVEKYLTTMRLGELRQGVHVRPRRRTGRGGRRSGPFGPAPQDYYPQFLTWGARAHNWPPNVTRNQRLGDVVLILRQMARDERR